RVGLVRLYRHGKFQHLIQYEKFHADDGGFNTPHPKEPESELPGPKDAGSEPVITPEPGASPVQHAPGTQPEHSPEHAGKKPGIVRADVEVEVKVEREVKVEDMSADADAPPAFTDLVEAWNT